MNDLMIDVRDVAKRYGEQPVLEGVTFSVPRGTTLSIMGGSGVGKSTLLKILIGAERPTSGQVSIAGEDIAKLDDRALDRVRRRFGVLFQDAALLNSMTVADNVALPIRYHGSRLNDEEIDIMVTMKLQMVDMLHRKEALPGNISGGQRKRAGLARALALDPVILFYDEPTSGLDPRMTADIDELINDLKSKLGMTSIVVTHDVQSAFRISDQILILDKGRIIARGSVEEIRATHHQDVIDFIEGRRTAADGRSTSQDLFLRDLLQT